MKREELTTKVLNLHEQAKKTEFSDLLISRVQLEGQVTKMEHQTLEAIARFYESLLEESNS